MNLDIFTSYHLSTICGKFIFKHSRKIEGLIKTVIFYLLGLILILDFAKLRIPT